MTSTDDTRKGKRRGLPVWLIIVIIFGCVASLSTCVWGFRGLFQAVNTAKDKTDDLLSEALLKGLPNAENEIYLSEGDMIWKQTDIDRINLFLERVGKPRSAGDNMCFATTQTGTDVQSGTFSTCNTPITHDATPARVTTVWKMKEDGPLLMSFNINVENEKYGRKILSDIALIERGIDPETLEKTETTKPQEDNKE